MASSATKRRSAVKRIIEGAEGPTKPSDLPIEYLVCRGTGHEWTEIKNPHLEFGKPPWGVWEAKRCKRCTSKSAVCVNRLGEISYRRYRYVDGYCFVGRKLRGGTAFTKRDYRRELYKRKWYEQREAAA